MCTRVHVRVYTRVRVRTNGCKRGKAIDASTLCSKSAFSSLFALHICVFFRFFRLIIHREDSLTSLFLFYLIRSSIRSTMARNDVTMTIFAKGRRCVRVWRRTKSRLQQFFGLLPFPLPNYVHFFRGEKESLDESLRFLPSFLPEDWIRLLAGSRRTVRYGYRAAI